MSLCVAIVAEQLETLSMQAPGEAEAQCAELARAGKVYAAGSEDMDTLTFNSPILLRHLTFSEAKRMPISEIQLSVALEELQMTMDRVSDEGPSVTLALLTQHSLSNSAFFWDATTSNLQKASAPRQHSSSYANTMVSAELSNTFAERWRRRQKRIQH